MSADLRRPRLHELFGAPMSPGLTTVLLGDSRPGRGRVRHRGGTRASSPATGLAPTQPRRGARLGAGDVRCIAGVYRALRRGGRRLSAGAAGDRRHGPVAQRPTRCCWSSPTARRRGAASLGPSRSCAQVDAPLVGTVVNRVPADEDTGGRGTATTRTAAERAPPGEAGRGSWHQPERESTRSTPVARTCRRGPRIRRDPRRGVASSGTRRPGVGTCRALRCHSGERCRGGIDGRAAASGSARRQRQRWPGPRVRAGQRGTRRGDSARGRLSAAATAAARS